MLFDVLSYSARGRFILDTLSLVAGAALAQGIALVVSPILTRLYSAEEFGIFSLYNVIVSTGSAFVCLGYEPAILLPREDDKGASMLVACVAISALVAGFSLMVVFLFGPWLAISLKAPGIRLLLWWAPANLVAVGLYQALSYWVNRRGRFVQLSASRFLQSGATAIGQVSAGMVGGGASGLVFGQIFGQILSSSALALNSARSDLRLLRQGGSGAHTLIALLIRYRQFPQYSTCGTLMNTSAYQLVPLVLSTFFGPAVAGFYFLGFRVISTPLSLLGTALGQVLLQRSAAELSQGRSISRLVESVVGALILLSIGPFLLLFCFAPWVFAMAFGRHWMTAGHFMQALAPLCLLQFITSPVSVVLIALNRQKVLAILQGSLLVGTLASLTVARSISSEPITTLAIYALTLSCIYVVYFLVVLRYSSASLRNVLGEITALRKLFKGF